MRQLLLPFLFSGIAWALSLSQVPAQPLAGRHVYEFMNLSPSARTSYLGGTQIAVRDADLGFGYQNPSVLNRAMHNTLAVNHSFHLAGINHGYAAYARHFDKLDATFQGGIQYISYGEFEHTDEFFQRLGTFKASEVAINLGGAKAIYDRLSVGANLRLATSRFETYTSVGMAVDVAATYFDTAGNFTAALVFRHIGFQFSPYWEEGERESLPFEIQIGISKRLKYLPFRFSVIYTNLQRWNLLYDDPNRDDDDSSILGEESQERSAFAANVDNFFRHIIFSGEFLFGKRENFRIGLSYNHRMRKELLVSGFGSLAGFGFGAGFRVRNFRFDYGHTHFHNAGGLNHLGLSFRFGGSS